ncbi:MAG: glutaredoxin family protein [Myxococcales bacterium]|nr:glutaredoxin family protein [Myxococcales bacterium]
MLRWVSWGALAFGLLLAAPAAAQDVTVYGADWCRNCRMMRAYLSLKGIPYTWRDTQVPANLQAMKAAGGTGGIPFWIIQGRKGVGFDRAAIDGALGGRPPARAAQPAREVPAKRPWARPKRRPAVRSRPSLRSPAR